MIGVAILGSTGSIGRSTLDVLARHPERYRAVALTANTDVEGLAEQCASFRPEYAVIADPRLGDRLRERLRLVAPDTRILAGAEGLQEVGRLPQVDSVMAAIVGAAGLLPALAAVQAGKRVLLANKEALVMAGDLFTDAARRSDAQVLPVDSEHNAVFQCLPTSFHQGLHAVGVRRIMLTASGGPFRATPLEILAEVTPEQACAHPNWSMGRKISVDSATMMNKGLEVIEAHWLFAASSEQIRVVIHPQSIVHSLVEYVDGSVLAQLGNPDMRTPIAYALAWPERIDSGVATLDLFSVARLDFEPPDLARFPCLRLAYEALAVGGTAPTVLNAANEVAVDAFLQGRLPFLGIPRVIERTLEQARTDQADSLDTVLATDAWTRQAAERLLASGI